MLLILIFIALLCAKMAYLYANFLQVEVNSNIESALENLFLILRVVFSLLSVFLVVVCVLLMVNFLYHTL